MSMATWGYSLPLVFFHVFGFLSLAFIFGIFGFRFFSGDYPGSGWCAKFHGAYTGFAEIWSFSGKFHHLLVSTTRLFGTRALCIGNWRKKNELIQI